MMGRRSSYAREQTPPWLHAELTVSTVVERIIDLVGQLGAGGSLFSSITWQLSISDVFMIGLPIIVRVKVRNRQELGLETPCMTV